MANLVYYLQFFIYQILEIIFFFLPRKICLFLGRASGFLAYYLDRKHRQIALSNLQIAFGREFSSPSLKKTARSSFVHFGQTLIDLIKISHLKKNQMENLITPEGEENLEKVLRGGKGVLLFSGHFGNWEIASFFLSRFGKLWVTARPLDNKLLEKELTRLRTSLGANIIYKQQATRQILHSLRQGEMVALLIDQNVLRSQAIFVDFFGKSAATTPSLASFYLRTKSPILPVFCYPTRNRRYRLKISEPLKIALEGNHEQDVLKITQTCTKIIETEIRRNPGYWLWLHKRWKTRPKNEEQRKGIK